MFIVSVAIVGFIVAVYLETEASPNVIGDFGSARFQVPLWINNVHPVHIKVRHIGLTDELVRADVGQNNGLDVGQPLLDGLDPCQRLASLQGQ